MSITVINAFAFGAAATVHSGVLAHRTTNSGSVNAAAVPFTAEIYDSDNYFTSGVSQTDFTIPATGLYRLSAGIGISNSPTTITQFRIGGSPVAGCGVNSATNSGEDAGWTSSGILSLTAAAVVDLFQATANNTTYGYNNNANRTWVNIEPVAALTKYALVAKTGNQALSSGVDTALSWDTETADTTTWHDNVTANTRLTVPSGVACVMLHGAVLTNSFTGEVLASMRQGGTWTIGLPYKDRFASGIKRLCIVSAPLVVSSGNYFEMYARLGASGSITADNSSWFQIEEVPSTYKRALVYGSSGYSVTTSFTAMPFDSEVYDTDSIHDNASSNSHLTVPSGVSEAKLMFMVKGANAAVTLSARVTKNGSEFVGSANDSCSGTAEDHVNAATAWLPVTPGDYFELQVMASSSGTLSTDSWFAAMFR